MKKIRFSYFLAMFLLCLLPTKSFSDDFEHAISMTSLIVNKERYLNKKIRISGYYSGKNYPYIFLSKDHADISDLTSGVHVADHETGPDVMSKSPCQDQYIIISGNFRMNRHGIYAVYDVKKATAAKSAVLCWEKLKK